MTSSRDLTSTRRADRSRSMAMWLGSPAVESGTVDLGRSHCFLGVTRSNATSPSCRILSGTTSYVNGMTIVPRIVGFGVVPGGVVNPVQAKGSGVAIGLYREFMLRCRGPTNRRNLRKRINRCFSKQPDRYMSLRAKAVSLPSRCMDDDGGTSRIRQPTTVISFPTRGDCHGRKTTLHQCQRRASR